MLDNYPVLDSSMSGITQRNYLFVLIFFVFFFQIFCFDIEKFEIINRLNPSRKVRLNLCFDNYLVLDSLISFIILFF